MLVNNPVVGMKYHEISWNIIIMPCFMLINPHVSSKSLPNNISKIPVEFPTSSRNLFNVLVSRVKRTAGRAFTATSQRHRFRRMEPSRDSSKSLQSSKPWRQRGGTCRGRWIFGERNGQKRENKLGHSTSKSLEIKIRSYHGKANVLIFSDISERCQASCFP